MDQLLSFAQDYWVILAVILFAVFFMNVFLKAVFRLTSFLTVVGVILIIGFNYSPTAVVEMGRNMVKEVDEMFTSTVKPLIDTEIKDADYIFHPDGTYEIKTTHLRIQGKKGDPTATVYYKDFHFEVDIEDLGKLAQQQIEEAEKQQQQL